MSFPLVVKKCFLHILCVLLGQPVRGMCDQHYSKNKNNYTKYKIDIIWFRCFLEGQINKLRYNFYEHRKINLWALDGKSCL